jgi:DNA-binding PadR family transcriptional regulator
MSDTRDVDDFLPLTPAALHIMLVLADGPTHGYAVMQEVARLTQGRTLLGAGTLYRTIHRLLEDGLIDVHATGSAAVEDERRSTYRLTKRGDAVVRAECERLSILVDLARRRGLLAPKTAAARGSKSRSGVSS